ncbi:DUF4913 domain-containing protein [Skermania piniformis]|uniref:DUF4913 domain-containing protein n=1 Tax=Skermania pinensis TaxID=39122 RepID=A0ABX8SC32_9ACTN|nr:DUF4913 domain-containing protein [Skermania piniformis]QXQ15428.1 DUF4913 domain-containing protein [Skermania piniformis]
MSSEEWPSVEGPVFHNVFDFVSNYLAEVYRRQVTDVSDRVWCPQWWEHPEAWARFTALWQAWEAARVGSADDMSRWWLGHADNHMKVLLDVQGPFVYCSVRDGHRPTLGPLPIEEPRTVDEVDALRQDEAGSPSSNGRPPGN